MRSKRVRLSPQVKLKVLRYYYFRCIYCGEFGNVIDHVIPYSFGGDNSFDNLVASCEKCNGRASKHVFSNLAAKIHYVRNKKKLKRDYIHPRFIGIEWGKLADLEKRIVWVTCNNCKGKFQSGRLEHGHEGDDWVLCHVCYMTN